MIRKGIGDTKDTLADFGMATGEIPWPASWTAKDIGEVDCPGESGTRVFFPDEIPIESYDLEIEFKYRDEDSKLYDRYSAFSNYLRGKDGNGTELQIYSPYHKIGRKEVYAKSISDATFKKDNIGEYASFKVTFRVSDPETDIILARS